MDACYKEFKHLAFELKPNGVLVVTINRPEQYNAVNEVLHEELSSVWSVVARDSRVRVAVITGAGKTFCVGGDMAMLESSAGNPERVLKMMREARALVESMMSLPIPIVSAINGPAAGAGLAVAIVADVSIAGETIKMTDGHTKLGVAAGDHACLFWPLLCGLAKSKYLLMTGEAITGKEAERIGLVSLCVPNEMVLEKALQVADTLSRLSLQAVKHTKKALNLWLRNADAIMDASLAMEMLDFHGADVKEGIEAFKNKRAPVFQGVSKL